MNDAALNYVCEQLKQRGYRMTQQRRLILLAALNPRNARASSKEIYLQVRRLDPTVGVATVYRTLRLLDDEHIVEKLHEGMDRRRFLTERPVTALCPRCGAAWPLEDEGTAAACLMVARERGHDALDCRLQLMICCENCKGGK